MIKNLMKKNKKNENMMKNKYACCYFKKSVPDWKASAKNFGRSVMADFFKILKHSFTTFLGLIYLLSSRLIMSLALLCTMSSEIFPVDRNVKKGIGKLENLNDFRDQVYNWKNGLFWYCLNWFIFFFNVIFFLSKFCEKVSRKFHYCFLQYFILSCMGFLYNFRKKVV